jgi:hypothetical protein
VIFKEAADIDEQEATELNPPKDDVMNLLLPILKILFILK